MKRYRGEALPPNPRIAVVANDALGNFVAATPLLQMLRFKWSPCQIVYFGGSRTWELQRSSDLFEETYVLHGDDFREVGTTILQSDPFDLVVNMEQQPIARAATALLAGREGWVVGPCFGADGRGDLPYADDEVGRLAKDKNWLDEITPSAYEFLDSGFIGEIFCRLAYLDGPVPTYRVPSEDPKADIPDVLIATAASLPEKLWPIDKWQAAVRHLICKNLTVGLLGAKPTDQGRHWQGAEEEEFLVSVGVQDLRGIFSLPGVVGALERARLVLTIDNGILHLAAAAGSPTIGLFRHGIHRLWAPPFANLTVLTPGEGNDVSQITVETVQGALDRAL